MMAKHSAQNADEKALDAKIFSKNNVVSTNLYECETATAWRRR